MASQKSWRKPDTGRSRSGCANCKAKHVKCDEAKPNCKACLSRGDTCSGYLKVFRWSNKHEKLPKDVQWCTDSSGFANAADGSFSTNVLGGVEGLNIFDNLSRGSSDLGLSPPRLEDTGVPPPSYMFQHLSLSTGSTRQKRSMCEKDFKLLHAFNKSWTYYDMLLSVAAGNGPRGTSEMESVDDISADGYPTAEQTQLDIDQESPHPWTGVSTTISRLFTRTMKVTQRLPSSILTGQGNTGTAGDELVIPLGLRLVKILKQLPPDSGSRMTQPLLCITASIGPRFTSSSATPTIEACDMSDYINYLCRVDKDTEQLSSVTRSELEIDNARQFLLCRLNALEMALPPWPVVVARNLVKSIWNAYDTLLTGLISVEQVLGSQVQAGIL
ncbi:hypothetical protein FOXG_15139 [Fusarium oxysporum f. sp. lycopersici 4287]|uniref:Zn(2)-C6 fungal-type domain-containing protein n=2 Tax=Fusarium oxysporum TaxID=5507 RepID=A0A0J9W451_FUSO4|nr:hypothetical protein FOXG_14341 [Fusarium oxysporum f. sp. lycopersici 4287]XP_018255708.1 hypothetical protein FOXG_15139 [Fusarium oxysporum f. sp. lycopersici 4287]KNB16493.1 hypothetical protein FOXG_14341 [Fusarium oxysporum f. sp. lycopersici 4287]KNB17663.1 hypothetical protein FOXG_15139 [Fusarium oxysporum f. sp. lycopersici 4287]